MERSKNRSDVVYSASGYTMDHEILTDKGFMRPDALFEDKTARAVLIDPVTRKISHERVKTGYRGEAFGGICVFERQKMNIAVSPTENMLSISKYAYEHNRLSLWYRKASYVRSNHFIPMSGFTYEGDSDVAVTLPADVQYDDRNNETVLAAEKEIDIKDYLYLLGFYLSCGKVRLSESKSGRKQYFVGFLNDACKPLLERLGFDDIMEFHLKGKVIRTEVRSKQLYTAFSDIGGMRERRIPSFVWNYSSDVLMYLAKGYIDGSEAFEDDKIIMIRCRSERMIEDMQHLILKAFGRIVQVQTREMIYKGKKSCYHLFVVPKGDKESLVRWGEPKFVNCNDEVFQVSFEGGDEKLMVLRRGNKISLGLSRG